MATTRKRARVTAGQFQGDDPATPDVNEAWVEVSTTDLGTFMELEHPDHEKLAKALDLAKAAAAEFMGQPVPVQMRHELRQGIRLLAAQLLLKDALTEPVDVAKIPLVARYYFRLASAQG